MALTEVAICNMALSRLGVSRVLSGDVDGTLANCTDPGPAKAMLDIWYPRKRNALLEMYRWSFARKYATLVEADDGTGEVWEDAWEHAYTYPADCVEMISFVVETGKGWYLTGLGDGFNYGSRWAAQPYPFEIGLHDGAKVIFSDVATTDADVQYTSLVTDVTLYTEEFVSGLAWLIAGEVARPLSVDEKRALNAEQIAGNILMAAASSNKNEQEPRPESDGTFVTSRWGG